MKRRVSGWNLFLPCFLPFLTVFFLAFPMAAATTQLSAWTPVVTDSGLLFQGIVRSDVAVQSPLFRYGSMQLESSIAPSVIRANGKFTYLSSVIPIPSTDSCWVQLQNIENSTTLSSEVIGVRIPHPSLPDAITLTASVTQAMPQDRSAGVTINGVIAPHDNPTRYYFEFGTSEAMLQQTPAVALGGALTSVYQEDFESSFTGLMMPPGNELSLTTGPDGERVGTPSSYTTFLDFNHRSGVGTILLTMFGYASDALRGFGDLGLGGGQADFRDAVVSVRSRTDHFDAQGTKLRFWAQSLAGGNPLNNTWIRANWYNEASSLLPDSDNVWEQRSIQLRNISTDWIYAGTDLSQQRNWRYAYWPIDSTLGRFDTDFLLTLSPVDTSRRPSGDIYFDDLSIRYRNTNLLSRSNGGALLSSPVTLGDPSALTDGVRAGGEHGWISAAGDTTPQVFVFAFDSLLTLQRILLAQHPEHPTKNFSCSISNDGIVYQEVWNAYLDSTKASSTHLNYKRLVLNNVPAKYLKVALLSGYQDQFGVAEIEAYGTGAALNPGSDSCYVNADVHGFAAGQKIFYRLIAENSAGMSAGQLDSCIMPADSAPLALTQGYEIIDQQSADVRATCQGRGKSAQIFIQHRPSGDSLWKNSPPVAVPAHALQYASQHWFHLDSLPTGSEIVYRAVVTTASGVDTGRTELLHTPTNHSPVLVSNWSTQTDFDSDLSFDLRLSDPDSVRYGDHTRLRLLAYPGWMSVDTMQQLLSGRVPFTASCNDSVVAELTDNKGARTVIRSTFSVRPLPAPAIANFTNGDLLQVEMPAHTLLLSWRRNLSDPSDTFYFCYDTGTGIQRIQLHDTICSIDIMRDLTPGGQVRCWLDRRSGVSCLQPPDTLTLPVKSIVLQAVNATTPYYDFGDIAVGENKVGTVRLLNTESERFSIDSVIESKHASSPFTWAIDGLDAVPGEKEMSIACSFSPKALGSASDTVTLFTPGGVVTFTVAGNSPLASPILSSTQVDFGTLAPDSVRTLFVEVHKSGINSLRVVKLTGLTEPFEVNTELAPVEILDSNSAVIPITIVPQQLGQFVDTLFVESNSTDPSIPIIVQAIVSVPTDARDNLSTVPTNFALHQNYPNPFNPSTTISYDLAASSHVDLRIFNVLGREVEVLSDEVQPAGRYAIKWSSNFSSGVYFVRLIAEEIKTGHRYEETRKIVRIE